MKLSYDKKPFIRYALFQKSGIKSDNYRLFPLLDTEILMRSRQILIRNKKSEIQFYAPNVFRNGDEKIDVLKGIELYFQVYVKTPEIILKSNGSSSDTGWGANIFYKYVIINSSFSFLKESDDPFSFFIEDRHGEKYFKKLLIPQVPAEYPKSKKFTKNSLDISSLPVGVYEIDNQRCFYDKHNEIKPDHVIFCIKF